MPKPECRGGRRRARKRVKADYVKKESLPPGRLSFIFTKSRRGMPCPPKRAANLRRQANRIAR